MIRVASKKPMMNPGRALPRRISPCRERRDQQLVESALLAFAGDRKGGHQRRHHQRQQADNARHDEPAAQQVGIEPRAVFEAGLGERAAGPLLPIGIEGRDDGVDVIAQDGGGVRVASVHEDLDRAGASAQQFAGELGADAQHHQHALGVDLGSDFGLARDDRHLPEVGRSVEAGDEVARALAGVFVINGEGDAVKVEGSRVAEYHQLDERRHEDDHPAPLVFEQGQELFQHQGSNSLQHRSPIPNVCAACGG